MAADDFVRSKRSNAKLLHPKDIGTSISKPGDFDMVYEVKEPPPGETIIVEAKGGGSQLGSRKIGNEAYQQGKTEYAAAITKLMQWGRRKDEQEIKLKRQCTMVSRSDIYMCKLQSTKRLLKCESRSSQLTKENGSEVLQRDYAN
ncbi:TPA: hypothetical protein ACVO0G_004772 [Vibrio diabolicus]